MVLTEKVNSWDVWNLLSLLEEAHVECHVAISKSSYFHYACSNVRGHLVKNQDLKGENSLVNGTSTCHLNFCFFLIILEGIESEHVL